MKNDRKVMSSTADGNTRKGLDADHARQLADERLQTEAQGLDRHFDRAVRPVAAHHVASDQAGHDDAHRRGLERSQQEEPAGAREGEVSIPELPLHFDVDVEQGEESEQDAEHCDRQRGATREIPHFVDQEHRQVAHDHTRKDARHGGVEQGQVAFPAEAVEQEPEGQRVHQRDLGRAQQIEKPSARARRRRRHPGRAAPAARGTGRGCAACARRASGCRRGPAGPAAPRAR